VKSWRSVRRLPGGFGVLSAVILVASVVSAETGDPGISRLVEAYVAVPMPPGFHVESTELDGPVFADANGRTLYTWPSHKLRNGNAG